MLGDSTFGFPTISVVGCGSRKRADRTQHGSARMQQLLVEVIRWWFSFPLLWLLFAMG
jgi:hypothetical protein